MAVQYRPTSKWWYGRWRENGKAHVIQLGVAVEGQYPTEPGQPGDQVFEASRQRAREALAEHVRAYREKHRPEEFVQTLHKVKFGARIGSVAIKDLYTAWLRIPRKKRPGQSYLDWAKSVFKNFTEFLDEHYPKVKELAGVSKAIAEAFMRKEDEKRGVSPKTFNAELILLRGAFEHLREDAGMLTNPFGRIITKDKDTIHRKPFSPDELKAILDAAKDDNLMRPMIVVGMTTAMRRGDACLLKWEAVDLQHRFVTVKTSKTGANVAIPMFPLLFDELKALAPAKGVYVFPRLAAIYQRNPDWINKRMKVIFAKAGFVDADDLDDEAKKSHRGDIHAKRPQGLMRANIRGFHSFRVTWITLALTAGVPMELVRRVTGHKTVDVVLQNYFQPGREEFRRVLQANMPKLLSNGQATSEKSPTEQALEILEAMKARTWKQDREMLLKLLTEV